MQQRGLRAGTQDVPGAAALAAALEESEAQRASESIRLAALRDGLVAGILDAVPSASLLGDAQDRLPGNAHLLRALRRVTPWSWQSVLQAERHSRRSSCTALYEVRYVNG